MKTHKNSHSQQETTHEYRAKTISNEIFIFFTEYYYVDDSSNPVYFVHVIVMYVDLKYTKHTHEHIFTFKLYVYL